MGSKPRRDVTRVPGAERETRQGERLELEVAVFVRLRPRAGDVTVVVPASHARPIAEHERRGRAGGTCRHRERCRRGNHGPASRVRASFRADHARKRRARLRGGWKTPTARWKAPRARVSGATTAVRALRDFVRKRGKYLLLFQRAFNERFVFFKKMHRPSPRRSRARSRRARPARVVAPPPAVRARPCQHRVVREPRLLPASPDDAIGVFRERLGLKRAQDERDGGSRPEPRRRVVVLVAQRREEFRTGRANVRRFGIPKWRVRVFCRAEKQSGHVDAIDGEETVVGNAPGVRGDDGADDPVAVAARRLSARARPRASTPRGPTIVCPP